MKEDLEILKNSINYLNYKPEKIMDNTYFCCSGLESRLDFDSNDLTKIAVNYNDDIDVEKINEKLSMKYEGINSYHVSKKMLEIISKDINKSKAIKLLANHYNLDDSSIYTIGDGYSDITMVKDYNGYAMKESISELKSVAMKTVNSVSELIQEIIY